MEPNLKIKSILTRNVVVSSLGYFVDIYDLVLFSIVRVQSLKSIQVAEENLMDVGVRLLNIQMIGMLFGGLFWGVMGDKVGRLSVLFGSILTYSLANIANAFVTSVEQYEILRFIAGVGLAGELGAAITLVSETLPKETRGYGTSIVAGIGVSGAGLAGIVGELFHWQVAYLIGGVLGLMLLVARFKMSESGMFEQSKATSEVKRGDIKKIVFSKQRLFKYLNCIAIGVPIWYVVGILGTFSPEIGKALNIEGSLVAGRSIMCIYMGLMVGDIVSGFLSQWVQSRKKIVLNFIVVTAALCFLFLNVGGQGEVFYYTLFFLIGLASGYWAIFVTVAAEQFGTNLRSTVAITVPNFVRASVVPATLCFKYYKPTLGLTQSALLVGVVCFAVAFLGLLNLRETFGVDLDYNE